MEPQRSSNVGGDWSFHAAKRRSRLTAACAQFIGVRGSGKAKSWLRSALYTPLPHGVGGLGVTGDGPRMLRDHIKPACVRLGFKPATWLTFRRSWSTWGEEELISPKIRGLLLGNSAEINQTVYTKVHV